ncbi:MFS transporter [Methanobacterium sp.]|uniref:MFS transporter n=1 Tax=Methanobacterium sp. TaxID=2164 RepID=UPI002ABB5761|nr:MFS transporter [Methanobacterium sp.]MDY9924354.1 MFS transporter [Methanobacterium sp.]
MMVPINASIINVSLPTISVYFGVGLATAQWVLTSYLITLLGFVLFFSRAGDFWGQERVYLAGLAGFVVTSLLCSLSPSIESLIIFRGLQGLAAAMMISVSMALVRKSFPSHQLGRALGIYAVAIAAGLALGPAIGGIMSGFMGWRSIFLVNLPVGILDFAFCYLILKRSQKSPVKWDIPGTVLQFICLFLTVYTLNMVENASYTTAIITGIMALGSLVLFIYHELRTENPVLKLKLFKNRKFSAFNLSLHFNYLCMYMMFFAVPFYLQKVLHLDQFTTGLVLTASPVLMMTVSPISGMISDKFGSRFPAFLGGVVSAVALLSMTQLTVNSNAWDVFFRLGLLGLGAALFQSPINKAIMSELPSDKAGMASGILATTRNLGMVFAVCYAGLILHSAISPELMQASELYGPAAASLTSGLHLVVLFGALLSMGMAFLSIAGIKNKKESIVKYEKVAMAKTIRVEKKVAGTISNIMVIING